MNVLDARAENVDQVHLRKTDTFLKPIEIQHLF